MSCKIIVQHFLHKYIYILKLLKKTKQKNSKKKTKTKKQRPNRNSSATHFWVTTHQLRNAASKHATFSAIQKGRDCSQVLDIIQTGDRYKLGHPAMKRYLKFSTRLGSGSVLNFLLCVYFVLNTEMCDVMCPWRSGSHSNSQPRSSILMVMLFIQLLGTMRMKREKIGG